MIFHFFESSSNRSKVLIEPFFTQLPPAAPPMACMGKATAPMAEAFMAGNLVEVQAMGSTLETAWQEHALNHSRWITPSALKPTT